MKKKINKFALAGILLLTLTSCGGPEIIKEMLDEYVYEYVPVFEDPYDKDMKIDGKLDEERWDNLNYLYFTEYNVKVEVTSFFTTAGVYVGGKAIDSKMSYYGRFDTKNNSGVDIVIAKNSQITMQNSDILRLQLDTYDRKSYYQDRFAGQASVEGELNSNTPCTMTFEFFASWKEIGYKNIKSSRDIPSSIKMVPIYRYVDRQSDTQVERHDITPTFGERTYISGFYNFNKNGYANPDVEGALLGNAKHGISKSDGWDLSHALDEDPYYLSIFRGPQSIYFKDIYAKNFVVETEVELLSLLGASNNPKFGLIAHGDNFLDFKAMYVRGYVDNKFYYDSNILRCAEMTYYPNRQTNELDYIYLDRQSDLIQTGVNKLKLKMIKTGKTLMFFVQDKLVYNESEVWFDEKMAPGLYAQDAKVKFTNFSARSFDDHQIVNYLADNKISKVSIPQSLGNGVITSKDYAIEFNSELTLSIKPTNGYMLTDLTVNGQSYYNQYFQNVDKGELVLTDLPLVGLLEIDAVFSKVSNTSLYIYGYIQSSSKNKVSYAEIVVTSSFNFLYFIDHSSSSGSYLFNYLPKDGDLLMERNGVKYYADGKYKFYIDAAGFRPVELEYYVNNDGFYLNGVLQEQYKDIEVIDRLVGGSVASNNFSYVSDTTGWDLSLEGETPNVITASRGSSNNPLYFSNVVSKEAVIEMTIQDCTPVGDGYDKQPSMGISMQTGGFRIAIMLDGTNIRLLPDFQWYNDSKHLVSGNNVFKTNNKEPIGFKLIQKGGLISLLVAPKNDGNYVLVYSETWNDLANLDIAYGLYSRSSGLVTNKFSNISINTDSSYVNSQIKQYLHTKVSIEQPSNGVLKVTDSNNNIVNNGDSIIIGSQLTITSTAASGYYVYANKVNGLHQPLDYEKDGRVAKSVISYTPNSVISCDIRDASKINEDINLSMSSQNLKATLETCGETSSMMVSGLHYDTLENIAEDSLERNIQIGIKPMLTDFSEFESLEYEIIEGSQGEKIVPYLVDSSGGVFKIGGERNAWKANRIAGSQKEVRSSNNWQGFSIAGGAHATYQVSLKDAYYYDSNITKYGGGDTSTLNLNNISYIGVQTYAYKGNHWSFTLLNIRGVKANGERVTIFDGSSTSVKTTNGDIGLLSNPNDAMLFYEFGQGGTVNYQTLTSLSNQEVTYIDPDSQLWKIKAGSGADIYSWNNILLPTSDTNVNLSFYDAISLDIDLSMGDWGDVERFFMEIELRYDDYGGTKYSRCKQYYLIDEDGNVTKSSTKIAKGFKGTVIALFEDFAINDNIMPHLYNIHNSSRIIIDTSGLDGVVFKLNNIRIISNGKALAGI